MFSLAHLNNLLIWIIHQQMWSRFRFEFPEFPVVRFEFPEFPVANGTAFSQFFWKEDNLAKIYPNLRKFLTGNFRFVFWMNGKRLTSARIVDCRWIPFTMDYRRNKCIIFFSEFRFNRSFYMESQPLQMYRIMYLLVIATDLT